MMPMEHSSPPIQTRASLSQIGVINIYRGKLGCRQVSDLLEHPASQGQSQQVRICGGPYLPGASQWELDQITAPQAMATPFNLRCETFHSI